MLPGCAPGWFGLRVSLCAPIGPSRWHVPCLYHGMSFRWMQLLEALSMLRDVLFAAIGYSVDYSV